MKCRLESSKAFSFSYSPYSDGWIFSDDRTTNCTYPCRIFLPGRIFFVFRRSFLSLVFFGYPITFGLVSAYIGFYELNDYTNDSEFWVAIGIGAFGTMLVFLGFWKTFFVRKPISPYCLQTPAHHDKLLISDFISTCLTASIGLCPTLRKD